MRSLGHILSEKLKNHVRNAKKMDEMGTWYIIPGGMAEVQKNIAVATIQNAITTVKLKNCNIFNRQCHMNYGTAYFAYCP
jgi:tagatose-1,6-bisphosphate aldolase non-catalytic subunit AgaZ/GatZ